MKKNPVTHFEIYADDPDKLAQFYSSLFDWSIEPVPGMDYRMVKTVDTDEKGAPVQPGGINGGLLKRPPGYAAGIVNYVTVDSLDGALERAQKLGARVTKGRTPVPGMGNYAMLIDPQGNHFALWEESAKAR